MPDRQKSTPQPPESERALRDTFLWRFDDPEHRDTLQRLGDLLFLLANEAHMWGDTEGWGLIPGQLNAAADDLEHLAGYLVEVAAHPAPRTLPPLPQGLEDPPPTPTRVSHSDHSPYDDQPGRGRKSRRPLRS